MAMQISNWASPYNIDPYPGPMRELWGTLSNYKSELWNVTKETGFPEVRNKDREDELAAKIDECDEKVRSLAQKIDEFRTQGCIPQILNMWKPNQEGRIADCDLLLAECERIAADPMRNNPTRAVQWHMRGPIKALTQMREVLIECGRTFGADQLGGVTPYGYVNDIYNLPKNPIP